MNELNIEDINGLLTSVNKMPTATEYTVPLHWVQYYGNEACVKMLQQYDLEKPIEDHDIPCWYDPKMNRLVLGLQYDGKMMGAVGRRLGTQGPKWYVYKRHNDALFSAPCKRISDTLLLVEDAFSAIKASSYVNSKALLGTALNASMIASLGTGWKKIIVALDPDAAKKNINFQHRLQTYYDYVKIEPITKDIKYYNGDELRNLFK